MSSTPSFRMKILQILVVTFLAIDIADMNILDSIISRARECHWKFTGFLSSSRLSWKKTTMSLDLFRIGFFEAARRWEDWGESLRLKICHKCPTMMKLGTVVSHLKKIQKKYMNHVTHVLSSAEISIFSPEISKFCYLKKYSYRLHFDT